LTIKTGQGAAGHQKERGFFTQGQVAAWLAGLLTGWLAELGWLE